MYRQHAAVRSRIDYRQHAAVRSQAKEYGAGPKNLQNKKSKKKHCNF
jgi:hypothetical protein